MSQHETVVELSRAQVEEMLRAYLGAKFQMRVTPLHGVRLTVHADTFVVRLTDPPKRL